MVRVLVVLKEWELHRHHFVKLNFMNDTRSNTFDTVFF